MSRDNRQLKGPGMAEDRSMDDAVNGEPSDNDAVLELNFVPDWARKPPSESHFREHEDTGRDRWGHGPRDRHDRGDRSERRDRPRRLDRDGQSPRDSRGTRPARREGPESVDRAMPRPPPREGLAQPARQAPRQAPAFRPPREDLSTAIEVRLVPSQGGVQAVARRVHSTRMAYPVMELAGIFITKPELTRLRLECRKDGPVPTLWQCRACGYLARQQEMVIEHAVREHMADHCLCETIESDPPAGNFICVARCGVSREYIAPPNHHSYADRVQALYEQHGGGMTLETYRGRIETMREPEAVEAWKEQQRRRTVYRRKPAEGQEPGPEMTRAESVRWFRTSVAPTLMHEVRRTIIPATVALKLDDGPLADLVHRVWERERRFPLMISFALRAAFRHMHLHVFKAGQGIHFVSPCTPTPLNPEHVVDTIREVLLHLHEHPGLTRKELIEALRPGVAAGSPEAHAVISPLGWLVERGHIIEFFNGTLSVPLGPRAGRKPKPE